eukprot:CAMPEP_0198218524 /NCGR_PEP_ID=MMETSP1445-20131203/69797_1 /TAXON_ID=36898 /ORGANISM="Pyramimonas sp., Strain CCMP2087" /LENGTH=38 /DNA_ID= /DNA_START= /DNA_END= /DNA_ORIENTATION=
MLPYGSAMNYSQSRMVVNFSQQLLAEEPQLAAQGASNL